jgi:hypothetical protein
MWLACEVSPAERYYTMLVSASVTAYLVIKTLTHTFGSEGLGVKHLQVNKYTRDAVKYSNTCQDCL